MRFLLAFCCIIIIERVFSLPCLTNDSKKDFDKTRKALTDLEKYLTNTVSTLQGQINTINWKVKSLDKDLVTIEEDFRKRRWRKYKGHCYYFSSDRVDWMTSERRCKEIGGFLVKIDNAEENTWLDSQSHQSHSHWIGLTDLKEGDFRWTYDQQKFGFSHFKSGYPRTTSSYGHKYNCIYLHPNSYWYDYACNSALRFICESNFCF